MDLAEGNFDTKLGGCLEAGVSTLTAIAIVVRSSGVGQDTLLLSFYVYTTILLGNVRRPVRACHFHFEQEHDIQRLGHR